MYKHRVVSAIVLLLVLALPLFFSAYYADHAVAAINGHGNVYVDASRPDDSGDGLSWATAKKTIQAGADIVDTGGTVHVAAGTYNEYDINISHSFNLEGAGALSTFIDGGGQGQVIRVSSYVGQYNTISGFTIQNGYVSWGNRMSEAGIPSGPGMPVGGGIYVAYAHLLILNDCTIRDNRSDFMGGGIYNAGEIQLNRCTLSGNSAGSYGGGIANFVDKPDGEGAPPQIPARPRISNGSMSMVNCTVSGNSIYSPPVDNLTVVNEASAVSAENLFFEMPQAMGGGVFNGGNASFMNVTIANNTISRLFPVFIISETADNLTPVPVFPLPRGGGFANVPLQCANDEGAPMREPTAVFMNTIVANNLPDNGFSFNGKTLSMGYNLDSQDTCGFHQYSDQVNTNPLLGPLQNNGGPTSTHAIAADSPAYNMGSSGSGAPPTDQRGIKRPQHSLYDIGAYEYAGALPPARQQFSFKKSESSSEIAIASSGSSSMSTRPFLPVQLPSVTVQSASLSAAAAEPGAPVTVTAVISNTSTVNGSKTVKVHVNGQEDASTGVAVDSGQTRTVTFNVSRDQPGTYTVYVDGASAGSFEVRDSASPVLVLVLSIAAILASAMLGIVYMLRRRQGQF